MGQSILRHRLAFVAALLGSLGLRAHAQGPRDSAVTAFVNVTVIPLDRERTLDRQTVVVRGERIVAMGPANNTAIPAGATRIDGTGKFLMPGLAEMHAHVIQGTNPNHIQMNRDIMFLYVANGITSIRAMLGAPNQIPLREQLRRGEVLGPTMYVSAPSLNGGSAPNPDTAVKLVRAHKAAGYDFLKIHPGLSLETYDAIARTAKEVGLTWAGHVPAAVGLPRAMASGQSTVDHLDGILEEAVPDSIAAKLQTGAQITQYLGSVDTTRFPAIALRMKRMGVWNVPTILIWENLFNHAESPEQLAAREEMKYWPRAGVTNWTNTKRNQVAAQQQQGLTAEMAARYLELRRQALRAVVRAGAPLLMGTDSPQLFMVPGFALHRELGIIASAGVTPYQIYESGAKNVARYVDEHLKQDGHFGTVAVGNRADLVLLNANPLQSVASLRNRAGVMVKGRWVSVEEIERGLAELASRYAQ
jgi:imidazolonepropionase-like amidohydrolase